ncbi:MAG: SufS family cysteine desulfurase [Alphaproteobacteria bacterium]|jgi:cysteine desulfurase/selenocysteine lyase|nr:SufS family cysteine desulfurase [Alphaproteobacteria bacterium]
MADHVPPKLDVAQVRGDFPILASEMNGRPLVYLDNAASTQKPACVIDELARFLREDYANIHRGVYDLSMRASEAHDGARDRVRRFLNASAAREVIFTRNGTEGINLVAQSYVRPRARPGSKVVVSRMEHHANIVPWQMLGEATELGLEVVELTPEGELRLDELEAKIDDDTLLVSLPWVSNVLGTVNPVHRIVEMAHAKGVAVLLDACQAIQHLPVDVQEVGCDFLVFSGHKVYGPSGIGVLWGKAELLEAMPPYQGGGEMISSVSFERTTFADLPFKFEAGTPAIEAAPALARALDYVAGLGLDAIKAHEDAVLAYGTRALKQIKGLHLLGEPAHKSSVLSFVMDCAHPHDIATLVDLDGVAIRTGHHCAQPLIEKLGQPAAARASIGVYNTTDDIDALVASLQRVVGKLG